jgi:hypothetical protein
MSHAVPDFRCLLGSTLAALTLVAGNGPLAADDAFQPIAVRLVGGQTFMAPLAPATDAQQLVLQWTRGTTVITRAFDWDRVASAHIAGLEMAGSQLRQAVAQVRSTLPPAPPRLIDGWLIIGRQHTSATVSAVGPEVFEANQSATRLRPDETLSEGLEPAIGHRHLGDETMVAGRK